MHRNLPDLWISEFKNGIEDTGIKPGFIKIAVNPDDTLSDEHMKIITAAAMTHLKTGLVIASHTGPDNPAFAQIDILKGKWGRSFSFYLGSCPGRNPGRKYQGCKGGSLDLT